MTSPNAPSPHRWRFFRAGGLDQPRLESAEDYKNLEHLDPKLWVALACPVHGIDIDEETLKLIDLDNDGRVRLSEVTEAVDWTEARLADLATLKNGSDTLPLDHINAETPEGKAVLASAIQILKNLGKGDATAISLADVSDTAAIFAQTQFNGDGIVPADAADDPAVKQVLEEIIATQGAEMDRSGKPGVSRAKVDLFFEQLAAFEAWAARIDSERQALLPLGESTGAAFDALNAVRAKVDDYFARTRLASFDARALAALNRREEEYYTLAAKDLHVADEEIASFPLARVEPGAPLPLRERLNPAWESPIAAFADAVVTPILGADKAALTEAEWRQIKDRFAAFESWQAGKPALPVEQLGLDRIRAILKSKAREGIAALIEQDLALEAAAAAIGEVTQLIRYYRDLDRLLRNFVNFSEFYDPEQQAAFQIGTLYIDGRACELCFRVEDAAKHATLAGLAKAYLLYCDCVRKSGEKLTIAVAVTNGDSDNLMVGRNGVFYDRRGRDWDATVTKIIENPISIREAFWSPYKKLVRKIEEQVAKRAAEADAASEQKLTAAATNAANIDKTKPAPGKRIDVGTVAALSVAGAFMLSALGTLILAASNIISLPFWQLVIGFGVLLMVISGPSMLIAWLKLRQRNLGPVLDASGWAVNGRVFVPVSLGRVLTPIAKLPPGTVSALDDRFGQPPVVWPKIIAFLVGVGFIYSLLNDFGYVYKWSDGKFGTKPDPNRASITDLIDKAKAAATESATNAPAAPAAPAPEAPAP